MFFPVRTDRPLKRRPWVNYGLIALNVVVFVLTDGRLQEAPYAQYVLTPGFPQSPELFGVALPWSFQYISYQFLHANWMHLLGNMLFLFVFGNNVEDRMGRVGYLFFYLSGGVAAGIGHALVTMNPVIGASGSVSAVTGAFLALFPLSRVTIIYWFIIIGAFEVTGMVLILFRMGLDFVFWLTDAGGNVAYMAHLAGYGHGFVVGMGLLLVRVLSREPYDLLSLLEYRRRRRQFERLTRQGYRPWEHAGPGGGGNDIAAPPSAEELALMQRRSQINRAIADHDMVEAARLYEQLLHEHPGQVLGQRQQLDLANHLMAQRRHDAAAAAYELFLKHFSDYAQREQVQLILGLIYARYLPRPERARQLLEEALPRLGGSDKDLAVQVLGEVK